MNTPDPQAPSAVGLPGSKRSALVPGLVVAVIGAVLSALLNVAIGLPDDMAENLFHQGVSGLITGAIGGFVGLTLYLRKAASAAHGDTAGRPGGSPRP